VNRDQKAAVIEEVAGELRQAGAVFAVDYRGISVPQARELREKLREADASFRVVKNRLTLRSVDQAGTEELKQYLEGPTALTLVRGDVALAAKTIAQFGKQNDLLEIKGGLMDGEPVSADQINAISRLPGREQLQAQLVGVIASPITGLVRGLGSMIQGLASQLEQIRAQGLVTGEAPAAEPEAPAEEAPAEAAPAAEAADDTASPDPAEEAPGDPVAEAETAEDETTSEDESPSSEGSEEG